MGECVLLCISVLQAPDISNYVVDEMKLHAADLLSVFAADKVFAQNIRIAGGMQCLRAMIEEGDVKSQGLAIFVVALLCKNDRESLYEVGNFRSVLSKVLDEKD